MLEASEGISYDWEPKVNLSAYDVRAPYMTAYHDHLYGVSLPASTIARFTEYFNIILSCDTLYPGGTIIALDTLLSTRNIRHPRPALWCHGWNLAAIRLPELYRMRESSRKSSLFNNLFRALNG